MLEVVRAGQAVERTGKAIGNRYLFSSKEDQSVLFGQCGFDFGAREYDSAGLTWYEPDHLASKYYGLSPYSYCAGNPVMYVDPDGNIVRLFVISGIPTGHSFVSVNDWTSLTLYSYGRYGAIYPVSSNLTAGRITPTGEDSRQSDGLVSSDADFDIPCGFFVLSHQLCVVGLALLGTEAVHSLHLRNEPFCVLTCQNRYLFNRFCHK